MARKPEQQLWDFVRYLMGNQWYAQRIENRVGLSTPDVYFTHPEVWGWLELKVATLPTRDDGIFRIPHWTPNQRIWMETHSKFGGMSWLVVQLSCCNRILVMRDRMALRAVDGWTRAQILESVPYVERGKTQGRNLLDALCVV